MHLLLGLFFLVLSMALFLVYLVALFLLPVGLRRLWQKMRKVEKPVAMTHGRIKMLLYSGLAVTLIFHGFIYVGNRLQWCGEDNANLNAKEYFVAGQPLAGLRLVLTTWINPDNPVLQPLHGLQHLIYHQGIKQLPENDGEIGVWTDSWFNYPYIRKMWEPYGTSDRAPSYHMRKLLDRIWFAMESMSTRPFADQQMEYANYQLNFPRSAFYYMINSGYYHDRFIGAAFDLLKDPSYVARNQRLYQWLVLLRERWIERRYYETIKKNYPKIEALRQVVVLNVLENAIQSTIYAGQFSCANSYLPLYIEARQEFVDETAENHVLKQLRRKEPRQADDLYAIGLDALSPAFLKYLLKQYCGQDVLGTMRFGYKNQEAEQRRIKDQVEYTFRNEIKLLEEGRHD